MGTIPRSMFYSIDFTQGKGEASGPIQVYVPTNESFPFATYVIPVLV
jgi:hypothetical protein